jgi:hypothetical protein
VRGNALVGTAEEGPGDRALLRDRLLVPSCTAVTVLALATGCGGGTTSATVTAAAARPTQPSATASALEALLPARVAGVRLRKASASGAAVFGGDAFSRSMTSFLHSIHRQPTDLRFANARDPSGAADIEVGVFELPGVAGTRLLQAIVAASRPGAPGLAVSPGVLAGNDVTKLTYPGGSTLYLHAAGSRVFYVGTQSERLAARVVGELP